MSYIVYVNNPNNKAIAHDTNCGKYRARRRDRTVQGYWSEIFETLNDAMEFARGTGKKNVDTCSFCIHNTT